MKIRGRAIALSLILLLVTTLWVGAATTLIDSNSVLSGRIAPQNLIAVGVYVKEGVVLANVESITGVTPAARAARDGIVREVLVKPGDVVRVGQVIARIEPATK